MASLPTAPGTSIFAWKISSGGADTWTLNPVSPADLPDGATVEAVTISVSEAATIVNDVTPAAVGSIQPVFGPDGTTVQINFAPGFAGTNLQWELDPVPAGWSIDASGLAEGPIFNGTVTARATNSIAGAAPTQTATLTIGTAPGAVTTQGTPETLYAPAGETCMPYHTARYFKAGVASGGDTGWGCEYSSDNLGAGFTISAMTGVIRAEDGAQIPAGSYSFNVTATNMDSLASATITVPVEVYEEAVHDVAWTTAADIEGEFAGLSTDGGVHFRIADGTLPERVRLVNKKFVRPIRISSSSWSFASTPEGSEFYRNLKTNAEAATFGFKCLGMRVGEYNAGEIANVIVQGVDCEVPNGPTQTNESGITVGGIADKVLLHKNRAGAEDFTQKYRLMVDGVAAQQAIIDANPGVPLDDPTLKAQLQTAWDDATGGADAVVLRKHPDGIAVGRAPDGSKRDIWIENNHCPWGGLDMWSGGRGAVRKNFVGNFNGSPIRIQISAVDVESSHNLTTNVWANTNDWDRSREYTGDPARPNTSGMHSNTAGSFDGGIRRLDMLGNVATGGTGRADHMAAYNASYAGKEFARGKGTGPKLNDPGAADTYRDIRWWHCIFALDSSIGLELSGVTNVELGHMTLVKRATGATAGQVYINWVTGLKIWNSRVNLYDVRDLDGTTTDYEAFGNVAPSNYAAQFIGPTFEEVPVEDLYSVFTPSAGVAGYVGHVPGSDAFDWSSFFEARPVGSAVASAQTYDATVVLDGTQYFESGSGFGSPAVADKLMIRMNIKPDFSHPNAQSRMAIFEGRRSKFNLHITSAGEIYGGTENTADPGANFTLNSQNFKRLDHTQEVRLALEIDLTEARAQLAVNGEAWGHIQLSAFGDSLNFDATEWARVLCDIDAAQVPTKQFCGEVKELTAWTTTTGGLHTSTGLAKVFTDAGEFVDIGAAGDATLGEAPWLWFKAGDRGFTNYGVGPSFLFRGGATVATGVFEAQAPGLTAQNGSLVVDAPSDPASTLLTWDLRHSPDGSTWTEVTGLAPNVDYTLTVLSGGDRHVEACGINNFGTGPWSGTSMETVPPHPMVAHYGAGDSGALLLPYGGEMAQNPDGSGVVGDGSGVGLWSPAAGGVPSMTAVQSVGSDKPKWVAPNRLAFDGTDWLDIGVTTFGSASLLAVPTEAWSVIVAFEATQNGTILARAAASGDKQFQIYRGASIIRVASMGLIDQDVAPYTGKTAIAVVWDGSELRARVYGGAWVTLGVGAGGENVGENITLGCRTSTAPGFHMTGAINHVEMIDRALDDAQVQAAFDHIASDYGL